MELREQITRIVDTLALGNVTLDFETTTAGKNGGFVISEAFTGMPQSDRQDLIWDALDEQLSLSDRAKITALLTLTPLEAELPPAAAG